MKLEEGGKETMVRMMARKWVYDHMRDEREEGDGEDDGEGRKLGEGGRGKVKRK